MANFFDVINTPYNPLDGAEFTAGPGPELRLRVAEDCARFSLRINPSHLAQAAQALGSPLPEKIGDMSSNEHATALCLGPDEWLLLVPPSEQKKIDARFTAIKNQVRHSLVNVGHRTVTLDVSGPAAAKALNAGCPLNLDAMAVGRCSRTILDKAEVVLVKHKKDLYQLEIVRSFSEYVWKYLVIVGREFNVISTPQPKE